MSKFVNVIIGGLEIAAFAAFVVFSGGIGAAAADVLFPIFGALLTAGTAQLTSGVGTLISGAVGGSAATGSGGIATPSRNPIAAWQICYGENVVGGELVQIGRWEQSA